MNMKTKRWISKPAEFSLFMPLLAVLSTTVSVVAPLMAFSNEQHSRRELEVPLRLLAAAERAQVPNPFTPSSIIILEDGLVMFEGQTYQPWLNQKMPELRAKIRSHMIKPDAAKLVIFMEYEAKYEQLVEVLNTFAACKCSHYQIAFLPPLVGPPLFELGEFNGSPVYIRKAH